MVLKLGKEKEKKMGENLSCVQNIFTGCGIYLKQFLHLAIFLSQSRRVFFCFLSFEPHLIVRQVERLQVGYLAD